MADVHMNDFEISLYRGGDVRAVKILVEDMAIEAPIGAEDDKNTFVCGLGGMESFYDFRFGVGVGRIELSLRESLRPGSGASR
jgi:hypothetical protein